VFILAIYKKILRKRISLKVSRKFKLVPKENVKKLTFRSILKINT